MSERLQKTVSERLERMHNYGPANGFRDGYTTAMKEVLLLLVAADGANLTNRVLYEEDAYIKDHTTEPTDREIEAAAFGIFKANVNTGQLNPTDDDYRDAFAHTSDMVLYAYRRQAKSALIEIRKAVTE